MRMMGNEDEVLGNDLGRASASSCGLLGSRGRDKLCLEGGFLVRDTCIMS